MGLTLSGHFGSAVSDNGVQIPPPPKSHTRSLLAKAARRRRKSSKRRLRRWYRRRRETHKRLGEPVSLAAPAPRSVVDLNQVSVNLRKDLRVGTLNTRTLKDPWRLEEACHLARKREIDILCVQEHRIHVSGAPPLQPHTQLLEGDWVFCFASAEVSGHGGVGVLLSPKIKHLLTDPEVTSKRILHLKVRRWRTTARRNCSMAT